jgi:hypothetical protein
MYVYFVIDKVLHVAKLFPSYKNEAHLPTYAPKLYTCIGYN